MRRLGKVVLKVPCATIKDLAWEDTPDLGVGVVD
jgi:hypothetical protein